MGLCLPFWGPNQSRLPGRMHRVTCLGSSPLVFNRQISTLSRQSTISDLSSTANFPWERR
jgi:hypothetical protein